MGLSGIGEFLIDMYYFTGEPKYLRDAFKLAEGVLLFEIERPEGIAPKDLHRLRHGLGRNRNVPAAAPRAQRKAVLRILATSHVTLLNGALSV
jgi:hypothetical protein